MPSPLGSSIGATLFNALTGATARIMRLAVADNPASTGATPPLGEQPALDVTVAMRAAPKAPASPTLVALPQPTVSTGGNRAGAADKSPPPVPGARDLRGIYKNEACTTRVVFQSDLEDADEASFFLSCDGSRMASCAPKEPIRISDMRGAHIATVEPIDGFVLAAAFSRDNRLFAASVGTVTRGSTHVWELREDGSAQRLKTYPDAANSLCFGADNQLRMLIPKRRGREERDRLLLWDPHTGTASCFAEGPGDYGALYPSYVGGHSAKVTAVDCSADGKTLVTASLERTVNIWRASADGVLHVVRTLGDPEIFSGRSVLAGGGDAWEYEAKGYGQVRLSPDGSLVAAGKNNGKIKIFAVAPDGAHDNPLRTLRLEGYRLEALAFSEDGLRLTGVDQAGQALVFDFG